MVAKQRHSRSLIVPLVLLILLAIVVSQLLRIQGKIEAAEEEQTSLERQLSSQQQANDALSSALEKAEDSEYLEELARDQLGYVTPGEKDFYDVSN